MSVWRQDSAATCAMGWLLGRNRVESEQWTMLRAHMGFDAFYCQPGVDGAQLLAAADAKDDYRRIANRPSTVGADFAREAPLLRPPYACAG